MENREVDTESRWVMGLSGIIVILFGIGVLAWPGISLAVFVWLFGIFAIVYGVVELVRIFVSIAGRTRWWTHLLIGAASIAAGALVLAYPGMTTVVLALIIAAWAIIVGIVEVVSGIGQGQFLTAIAGVISILFGFVLLGNPVAGAVALTWVIGVFAIVRGIMLMVGAFTTPVGGAAAG